MKIIFKPTWPATRKTAIKQLIFALIGALIYWKVAVWISNSSESLRTDFLVITAIFPAGMVYLLFTSVIEILGITHKGQLPGWMERTLSSMQYSERPANILAIVLVVSVIIGIFWAVWKAINN